MPPPPVASSSLDLSSESAPVTVQFTDTLEDAVTAWQWDFGDGASSTEQNPTHEYTTAGSSTVALVASGPGGSDAVVSPEPVSVKPGQLAEVAVTSLAVTLQVQGTARLQAKALDQFGNLISDAVLSWSLTGPGGTIDETGLYTAGTQAGSYEGLVQLTATQGAQRQETLINVTITPGALSSVAIDPTEVALDIGAPQRFAFRALDEFGNQVSDVLSSWSVPTDVGTIDENGLFTTVTKAGWFLGAIRLDVVKGTDRASATADVGIQPDPLATIEVQPSFAVVKMGASQQFDASGFDQFGNAVPGLEFLWSSTGDINQTGLYTAVGPWGVHKVIASAAFRDRPVTGLATVGTPPFQTYIFWDFTQGAQGWTIYTREGDYIRNVSFTANGLEFDSVGFDPIIESPAVSYPDGGNLRITIRMKSTANDDGELYSYSLGKYFSFTVNADGEWHEYVVDMPSHGDEPTILRVGPASARGHITIAWFKVEA